MSIMKHVIPLGVLLVCLSAVTAQAQTDSKIGIRAGAGTDISLSLAFGAGVNYLLDLPKNALELGVVFFGGRFKESTDIGIHTYDETTDLLVFGLMANYLIGYTPNQPGKFFIMGVGIASVNMEWEEQSTTDGSLGTPLPGGGSMQSEDASAGGSLLNLGFGLTFSGGFDVRIELPVIVSFSAPSQASSVIPTLILTAGLRF